MLRQRTLWAGGLLALALASGLASDARAQAGAVITTGNTTLGVNQTGELNFGVDPVFGLPFGVYRAGVGDAISPGCLCEGWGVSLNYGAGPAVSTFFNQNAGNGGLGTGNSFAFTPNTATSVVNMAGAPIRVQHAFGPSLAADVFQVNVTITNAGTETASALTYRRAMDWDVPPTPFSEFVTHQGVVANLTTNGGNILFASNNGFASSDPLEGPSSLDASTENADFVDNGPTDHGSLFDFRFPDLAPGESRNFNIFYGSAPSEREALAALTLLNANVYSLGQNSGPGGETDGTPATFLFAFGGVGGSAPGATPTNPVLPFVVADPNDPGAIRFDFPNPRPRLWYDPPFAIGFKYALAGGGEFTEVGAPPASFGGAGPFEIFVGGVKIGEVLPDAFFAFGPGVTEFDLRGIRPLDTADPSFPTMFPTFLDFTGSPTLLTMTPILAAATGVPVPASLLLLAGALAMFGALRRRVAA